MLIFSLNKKPKK